MKLRRMMFAAPKSGSGKTTITCACLQLLKKLGYQVAAYKCGPDYIDPMFHHQVIGVPSKNLDTFFTGEVKTREVFLDGRKEADIAILEGAMGLFDGLGGIREEGSSYHLAKVTKTPIILVVDAKGMGRSVLALLAGFLAYDTERLIRGVILNRMSKGYYGILAPCIEQELGLPVLGYFPEDRGLVIESRYLGLLMPEELEGISGQLKEAAETLQETISVEKLLKIAGEAEKLPDAIVNESAFVAKHRSVIAVARDEAFCFYYEDNLRLLRQYGADIKYFSPIHDTDIPQGCSGLLLGGGYPELYARQLSENTAMREAIRRAFQEGMPLVAECGGFLYLHSLLRDGSGKCYPMAGVFPGECYDTGKSVRFGYVEICEQRPMFLPEGGTIKGHEFHYFDSSDNGNSCLAVKPVTGRRYPCVLAGEHYWAGFVHLYYPSNPAFAREFVCMTAGYARRRMEE